MIYMFSDLVPSFSLPHEEILQQLCEQGVVLRYGNQRVVANVRERLELELDHIRRTGITKHFLLMLDTIAFAKHQGIPVGLGRDWQPSSLVAYVLGVTEIDPLQYGLIFEMWFNPERVASPCLEVDIAYNHCDELIEYVRRKHGEYIVPVIYDEAYSRMAQDERLDLMKLGRIAMLWRFVLDLHPQKSLAVIQAVLMLIKESTGVDVSLKDLPLDDPATYNMLTRGEVLGVFENGSPRLADTCKRIRPSALEDIAALVALDFKESDDHVGRYAARNRNQSPVFYEHPLLEPILRETHGLMLYREQYVQAVEFLAGYTRGGADLLRRANLRNDPGLMARNLPNFVEGCSKTNRIPEHLAKQLFDSLNKASKTCFPKSHAVSAALLAYRTAYLKAHYSREFYSALIEHHRDDPEYGIITRNEMSMRQNVEAH